MNDKDKQIFQAQFENIQNNKKFNEKELCGVVRVINNGVIKQPFPSTLSNNTHLITTH